MATILIIDDDSTVRKLYSVMLSKKGFEVITFGDGKSALRFLELYTVDLVITDIFMPEQDGFEIIIQLKRMRPELKVIAISGGGPYLSPDLYLSMAMNMGAVRIMSKPIGSDDLVNAINDILNSEIEVTTIA